MLLKNSFQKELCFCGRAVFYNVQLVYLYFILFFHFLQTKADLVNEYETKLQNVEFGLGPSAKTDLIKQ